MSFVTSEFPIFDIRVVDRLRKKENPLVGYIERETQRLEGAVVALVPETRALEHIERNRIRMSGGVAIEDELWLSIDETRDEPCGRDPVDSGAGTGDPSALLIFCFGNAASPGRIRLRSGLFRLCQCLFCFPTQWTCEEVDGDDLFKAPPESQHLGGGPFGRRFQLLKILDQCYVVSRASLTKLVLQCAGGYVIDVLNLENRSLSPTRSYSCCEPL